MAVDVKVGTVITAIAGLTITGVNNRDVDEIPENAEMVLPVFFPDPGELITDLSITRQSFGTNGAAAMDATYNLHYLYAHAKLGAGLSLNSVLPGMLTNLALILEVMATNDTVSGAVDLDNPGLQIGIVTGPNGAQFHGCAISLRVLEHING